MSHARSFYDFESFHDLVALRGFLGVAAGGEHGE